MLTVQPITQGSKFGALFAQLCPLFAQLRSLLEDQALQFVDTLFELRLVFADHSQEFANDSDTCLMGMDRLQDRLLKPIIRLGELFAERVVPIGH